jgi:DNA-binding transcriptional regulator LsrR (DeoR family)
MAEAAERYYVDGWSQDAVAEHLGTSRSNVSRILDAARREGVVRFVVDHPLRRHPGLERALAATFGVRESLVATVADPTLALVGRLAAGRLLAEDLDDARLAIGWGRTVQATIEHVSTSSPVRVEVVQVGGDLTMAPAASGHELVRRLAGALGGRHRFLHAPALVESAATAAELRSDPRIKQGLDMAASAAVALVGIGVPETGLAGIVAGVDTADAAAVVCARLIGDDGDEIAGSVRDRVISMELAQLRRIPTVIGVAAGAEKGRAVAATLRSRLVDVLVCDQPAAAAALDSPGAHHE